VAGAEEKIAGGERKESSKIAGFRGRRKKLARRGMGVEEQKAGAVSYAEEFRSRMAPEMRDRQVEDGRRR
jgi:hypothetical protein